MAQEGSVEAVATGQENGVPKAAAAVVGFASVKPQLVVPAQKAEEAVQFYKAAFGAEELSRVSHPKRKAEQETPLLLCAELRIGSSSLLVCGQADGAVAPKTGGGGVVFRLETEDVEAAVSTAVKAGAALEGELTEGEGPCGAEVFGKLRDPYGLLWIVASVGYSCVSDV